MWQNGFNFLTFNNSWNLGYLTSEWDFGFPALIRNCSFLDELQQDLAAVSSVEKPYLDKLNHQLKFPSYDNFLTSWRFFLNGSLPNYVFLKYTENRRLERCNFHSLQFETVTKYGDRVKIFPDFKPASMVFNKSRFDLVLPFNEALMQAFGYGITIAAERKESRWRDQRYRVEICDSGHRFLAHRSLKFGDFKSVLMRCAVAMVVSGGVWVVELVLPGKGRNLGLRFYTVNLTAPQQNKKIGKNSRL